MRSVPAPGGSVAQVTLVWAVPVVAAAAAAAIVASTARPLEDELHALGESLRALRDVRHRLAVVRTEVAESDALAAGFDRRHAVHPPGDGAPTPGPDGAPP